jgi:transposase InsO family protein
VNIGRDRFFEVLREKSPLLEKLPGAPRTTDSRHSLPVFRNLVKRMKLVSPNRARAADITYIRTDGGFLYLSLLMDLRSRKIVGFHAGDTFEAEGAARALEIPPPPLPFCPETISNKTRLTAAYASRPFRTKSTE